MATKSIRALTPLRFKFPGVKDLVIDTGANEITWGYRLNTNVIPTYGGEVVQILSCYVDAMTITGNTRDNTQLEEIYDWFQTYMAKAGLHVRTEQAIHFLYAERGWDFLLQVTQLPNFRFATDALGTEWTIQAEVVSDPAKALAKATRDSFTDVLYDSSMWNVGFLDKDPRSDPAGENLEVYAKNFADNFENLLASWVGGDFSHWSYDVTRQATDNAFAGEAGKATRQYYIDVFGRDFIFGGKDASPGTSGGTVTFAGGDPGTDKNLIVQDIAVTFAGQNLPAILGVTTALLESSLNPNAWNGKYMGLFQTASSGAGGGQNHRGEILKVEALSGLTDGDKRISKNYPAEDQIADAASWFAKARDKYAHEVNANTTDKNKLWQLAMDAQQVTTENNPLYKQWPGTYWTQAKQLIQNASTPPGDSASLAKKILSNKNFTSYSGSDADLIATANGKTISSTVNGQHVSVRLNQQMLATMLALCEKGFQIGVYAICSNHHDDGPRGHAGGFCFDIAVVNGYGIEAGGEPCRRAVLSVLSYLDNLTAIPYQLINGGVGNGANDAACLARNIVSSQVVSSASEAVSFYGQKTIDEHKNHIHVGY